MLLNATEKKLTNMFLDLYSQNELYKIKVKDICEKAQLSRVTFYTYFEDVERLLSFIEETTLSDVREIFKEWEYIDIALVRKGTIPMFKNVYTYVLKNRAVYKALFGNYGRHEFILSYNNHIKESIYRILEKQNKNEKKIEFVSEACQGCITQTSICWIENNFNYSVEEISYLCSGCIMALINTWS